MLNFPEHISLAMLPTPVEKLSRISHDFQGKNIFVKRDDLTGLELSGNKVRKLEYCLAKALAEDYDGIITTGGLGSNHCRASVLACRKLNLECRLLLRGDESAPGDANTFFMRELGFPIRYVTSQEYISNINIMNTWAAEEYEKNRKRLMVIPSGASTPTGCWGYIQAFQEIIELSSKNNIYYDTIFCAVGSGGTYAGLWLGNFFSGYNARIVGINVCDNDEYFRKIIQNLILQFSKEYGIIVPAKPHIEIKDGYMGPNYGICTKEQEKFIRYIFHTETLVLDPVYTGKAFHGMYGELMRPEYHSSENILFLHTGGVFGLFKSIEDFSKSREFNLP